VIRLRLLGTLELVNTEGREIGPVLQQPKRLALLAVLAAGGGTEWLRRDTLVGMFWPELTDEKARGALRRALTFLRTHVGDDVIRTRGDEVGVTPDAVWCDVAACQQALQARRWPDAVELHRGDLLTGVHVPSAPEFERWADDLRERLRHGTREAAARLATEADEAERLAEAANWRRRALEIEPHDEASLQHLLELLDRLGDRAGALRAYETFASRLAADLDLTPSATTAALVASLRARAEPVPTPVAPRPSADVLAIFPFAVRGPGDLQYLREGLVDLLSTKLDGAGDLRTVDPGSVLARSAPLGPAPTDPATARPVAEQLGAGTFLLGSVVADGERTLLRTTLYRTGGGPDVRVDAEAATDTGIFELVDDLVRQLLASRTQSLGGHLTRLGAMTTDSLPALRAYLDGERAYRRGRAYDSRAAYAGASQRDPAFALAHYRLATAHAACGDPIAALDAVDHASAGARRLSPHARMLLAAQGHLLRGGLADAERMCLRVLADRPSDVEAWYRLARVQLDGNRFRGRAEAEARTALEHTAALDPRHAAALADLARLAWTTGDRQAARRHATAYLDLSAEGDDAPVMAVLAGVPDASERLAIARPVALRQVAALEVQGDGRPIAAGVGPWPSLLVAHVEAARGNAAEMHAALARAAQLDRALALDHEGFLACMTVVPPAATLRASLETAPQDAGPASDAGPAGLLRPATRPHSLGLLLAGASPDDAEACARSCADADVPPWAATLREALAAGVRAEIALQSDAPDRALALLEEIPLGPWMHLSDEIPQCGLVAERAQRARALTALGREAEARAWLTPSAALRPFEWALVARR